MVIGWSLCASLVVLLSGAARADDQPLVIDPPLAAALKAGGWRDAKLVYTGPALRVVDAMRGRKRRLIVVTARGKLTDVATRPEGTLAVTAGSDLVAVGLTELQISADRTWGEDASEQSAWTWLIRDNGEVACNLEGSSRREPGKACGSGGWTAITSSRARTHDGVLSFVHTTEHTGIWSEPDGKGGCRSRSPVRTRPQHVGVVVPERGKCKRSTMSALPNDPSGPP